MVRSVTILVIVVVLISLPNTGLTQAQGDAAPLRQWASSATASSQYGNDGWSAKQATGEPNTPKCGDQQTAWASAKSNEQASLTLRFQQAVILTQINIHQSYSPGSIVRVEVIDAQTGKAIQIANSADKPGNTPCPGVFSINISDSLPATNNIVIYLDQSKIGKWNEIDAVELVGKPVKLDVVRQWASSATASSQYGNEGWSAKQATGNPNTPTCDDQQTAWASASSKEQASLTLKFQQAVIPTQINIHQSYSPGSIVRVEVIDAQTNKAIKIANSADKPGNTPCPGVFSINITDSLPAVNGVVIYLDQSQIGKWDEIDAVELVGKPAELDVVRQWASSATASSQYGDDGWSAKQATGEPNTTTCSDQQTAWASAQANEQASLTVKFQKAVVPTQINIYQTYSPGSIVRVEVIDAQTGKATALPDSADKPDNTPCPGVFSINITDSLSTVNGVVIYLDQSQIGQWNEIDAVELVGKPAK